MREELPVAEWPSALEQLQLLECAERYWIAQFEPFAAWGQYLRFLMDGRKPN